jgi:hypothetical protein
MHTLWRRSTEHYQDVPPECLYKIWVCR